MITTEDLAEWRIKAAEDKDWARCAELDYAVRDSLSHNATLYYKIVREALKEND
jgi:hypothetical protein